MEARCHDIGADKTANKCVHTTVHTTRTPSTHDKKHALGASVRRWWARLLDLPGFKTVGMAALVLMCVLPVVLVLTRSQVLRDQMKQQHNENQLRWRLMQQSAPGLQRQQERRQSAIETAAAAASAAAASEAAEATAGTAASEAAAGHVAGWYGAPAGSGAAQTSAAVAMPTCGASRFAVIVLVAGYETLAFNRPEQAPYKYAWLSVANKRAYAEAHGYALYVVPDGRLVPSDRKAPWAKFVAAKAVMAARPHHEWLMVIDADAFFMNLDVQLSDITRIAEDIARLEQRTADVLVARDCNGINSGSIIFRNSPWAWDHISELYDADRPDLWNVDIWWEQAAIVDLYKERPDVREHYVLMSQNILNAYSGGCEAESKYKEGQFILHFVGTQKPLMQQFLAKIPFNDVPSMLSNHTMIQQTGSTNSSLQQAAEDQHKLLVQQLQPAQHSACIQALLPVDSDLLASPGLLGLTQQDSAAANTAAAVATETTASGVITSPCAKQLDGAECFTSVSNLRGNDTLMPARQGGASANNPLRQVVFINITFQGPASWQNQGWPLPRPADGE